MRRKLSLTMKICLVAAAGMILGGWYMLLYQQEHGSAVPNRGDYVRLHILANSDSIEDQQVKLKVRDAVVAYLTPYVQDVTDARTAENIITGHKQDILLLAKRTLADNGAYYPVDVQLGTFEFPVRSYGALTLPAGEYHAVRILLGAAAGQNWWCVLFPPLCFIDGASTALAPVSANPGNAQDQKAVPEIRWKIAEFFNK